jgi:hypothetical protein
MHVNLASSMRLVQTLLALLQDRGMRKRMGRVRTKKKTVMKLVIAWHYFCWHFPTLHASVGCLNSDTRAARKTQTVVKGNLTYKHNMDYLSNKKYLGLSMVFNYLCSLTSLLNNQDWLYFKTSHDHFTTFKYCHV